MKQIKHLVFRQELDEGWFGKDDKLDDLKEALQDGWKIISTVPFQGSIPFGPHDDPLPITMFDVLLEK